MKKGLLLFTILLLGVQLFAQDFFSSKPDEFTDQVQKMMVDSKNEKLMAIGDELGLVFGDLTSEQKTEVIHLSNSLKRKGQKAPVFGYYYGGIVAASNSTDINATHITQFLKVCTTVFEKEGAVNFSTFIKEASRFMIRLQLYQGNLSTLQVEGGTFSFEYVEGSEPESILDKYEEPKEEPTEEDPFEKLEGGDADNWDMGDETSWEEEPVAEETPVKNNGEETQLYDKINYGDQVEPQPPVSGAVIKFENSNIIIDTPYDSGLVIENTSGSYMLSKNLFVGNGGKFSWASASDEMNDVYVELGGYNFKTGAAVHIKSEAAKMHYPEATDEVAEGVFQFKSLKRSASEPPSYPRFMSYKSNIPLKNIGEGIDYFGGMSLNGTVTSSASVYGENSTIMVSRNGKECFRAKSKNFEIGDTTISSKKALIMIFANEDTISHQGMYLNYNTESNKLTFYRGPKSPEVTPFYDTEHNVEIRAEKLSWDLNEEDINFSMIYASNLKSASVESIDFYTNGRFTKLQGISKFHPLSVLTYYASEMKSDEVFVSDLAKFSKQNDKTMRAAMMNLSQEGFINYTPGTGRIVLKRKAHLYARARREKGDWDQLLIYSRANNKNITYHLENDDLEITGVGEIMLSVQQNIKVLPDSGKVIMRGNRDLYFDGTMFTGQFEFTGVDYHFDYDSFFVNMAVIDSIRLRINTIDTTDGKVDVRTLGNQLVYSSGVLYIDKQNNKSHKKDYPEYPIFDATTGAYVFFNKKEILDFAYDTTVYFRIPPFVVDSLNENTTNTVQFDGTFYGGQILEPFNEILRVMPDYSFGFNHNIPAKGYDLYGGKGKLYNKLMLNIDGLRSDGKIEYLTTELTSPDFILYIDSVTTDTGMTAKMTEGGFNNVLYPSAAAHNYRLNWKSMEDSMYIFNKDSAIELYQGRASLDGAMIVTPMGTYGKGRALSGRAVATSPEMFFSQDFFEAKKADFHVNTEEGEEGDEPAIRADSVHLHYNMVDNYADFGPEEEGRASIEFPFMQYKTSISNGRWDMIENIVSMEKNEEEDIETSYFYSTLEEQDSLAFYAERAICDLDESTLKIYGVPYIKVADSKIIPDSNQVFIEENANIESFSNAIVIIDTLSEYHTLDSGQIDIISRHKYTGQALYQYVNALEDTFHIAFTEFRTEKYATKKNDNRVYTMSDGYVEEDDSLFISPRIQYYGAVELDARENFLYFDGYVKLDLKGAFLSDWFKFEGRINPSDVKIDLKDPKSSDGTPLVTGLHVYTDFDSSALYSTFIALKNANDDVDIMTTSGVFGYNPYQNEFRISEELKENGESMSGNVLVLNDSTSGVRYEGEFSFAKPVPKTFEIISGGSGQGNIATGEYEFNVLMTVYFKLPTFLMREMGDTIYEVTRGNFTAAPESSELTYRISEIAGDNPAELFSTSTEDYIPLFNISSKFNRTLVFSDLNLKWSSENSAFYSPDSMGLANIFKTDINSLIDGFMEIKHTPEGEEMHIYLQPDSSTWYYINYSRNTATLLSSSLSFNASVFVKSNVNKRTNPADFAFGLSDYFTKEQFIRHYKQAYQNKIFKDSLDPILLEQKQSELAAKIQGYLNTGKSKPVKEEEVEEEDIFFEESLDLDDELLDEDSGTDDLNLDALDEEMEDLDTQEEQLLDDNERLDDGLLDESDDESTAPKKKKKDKTPKEENIEESEEEESLLDDAFDDIEEEAPKEEKKKETPKEEPKEVTEEEEDNIDDPWAELNEKMDKKKKKKSKKGEEEEEKPEEEEDELLDSLDEELDDLDD